MNKMQTNSIMWIGNCFAVIVVVWKTITINYFAESDVKIDSNHSSNVDSEHAT